MKISVIVPFYNEEGNVDFVIQEIFAVLKELAIPAEIIAVNDGSEDETGALLAAIQGDIPQLRIITHSTKTGQAAALLSGFEAATGDVLVMLDGDRQNDFRDVPRLLPLLEKYDAVFGQRSQRQDPVSKLIGTSIAYAVRNFFLRDGVKDTACALRIIKKDALKHLIPIQGFQRFIPFLLKEAGVSFISVDVNHRPRLAGQSKYSMLRLYFLSPIMDLLFMWWYKKRNLYRARRKPGTHT